RLAVFVERDANRRAREHAHRNLRACWPNQLGAGALNSPNFQDASYSSSPSPTQFADAVQRAEFLRRCSLVSPGTRSWAYLRNPVRPPEMRRFFHESESCNWLGNLRSDRHGLDHTKRRLRRDDSSEPKATGGKQIAIF